MIEQLNSIAQSWWSWMWPMFWQVSVLIILIGTVDLLLQKRIWPQVRYAIWLLVLIKLILPPSLSLPTSIISQARIKTEQISSQIITSKIPAKSESVVLRSQGNRHIEDVGIKPFQESQVVMSNVTNSPREMATLPISRSEPPVREDTSGTTGLGINIKIHWHVYVMTVWLAVVLTLSLWVIVRFRKLRKFHAGKLSMTDLPQRFEALLAETVKKLDLRKSPEIALSRHISSPAVFGVFRPVLVLPVDTIHHLSPKCTGHILLHELAHIKRGDLLVNTLYMLLQIVYWFNPLLWLLRRKLQHLRELCCDATVARVLRDETADYRDTILEVTQRFLTKPVGAGIGLLGMTESSSRLLVRLKWLEKKTWKYRGLRIALIFIIVGLMSACILPMAKVRAKAGPSDKSQQAARLDPDSQSEDQTTNTVRGYVTDKLGRPRGNVYITTSLTSIRDAVRTDEHGQFTLELARPEQKAWMAYCQPLKSIGLFTIPKDYAGQSIHVTLDFMCAEVEGRVVDSQGKGLADRRIELITSTNEGVTYSSECYLKTDKYGNYSSSIPCGKNLTVRARLADGDSSERKYVTEAITLSDNRIFVPMPTLVIGEGRPEETDDGKVLYSGRIINEEGRSIEGARVRLYFEMPGWMSTWVKSVMTDENGRWKRRIPKEHSDLTINLLHPEYIKQSWQRVSSAELLNGANVMIMKHGLSLKGVVRNQQGEPVENALVDTGGGDGTSPYGEVLENCTTPRTLADGSFRVGGLTAESLDIIVSALGYTPQVVSVDITDGMKPIEVSLKKGRTYTGQVVDVSGNPIEGVKIDVGEWRLGNKMESITRITQTNSKGNFNIENLPDEGSIKLDFGKRDSGLLSFRKEIPEDLSAADRIVMYKTPVFVGKIVDAETSEPVTNFTLTVGIASQSFGDSVHWSRYYREDMTSGDGTFSKKWTGYLITYPFESDCCLKVEAKGYLAEIAPPIKLGEQYEPCVIRMTKADSWKGVVIDPKGAPAIKGQVGWVGPGQSAFIKNGKFDISGLADQAEVIVETDSNGQFELPPSRDEALIVALHESGYASVASGDFKNASQIRLIPWARIEGTIVSAEKAGREFVLSISPVILPEEPEHRLIRWMFDRTSFSGENFTVNFVPSIPLNIGQVIESKRYDAVYINPQPGETYKVRIEGKDQFVAERNGFSLVGKALPDLKGIEIGFNPAQYKDKMILVCFWDMNQRPSRNCMSQLAGRVEQLREKGVILVAIQASKVNKNALDQWARENDVSFSSGMVGTDEKETLSAWNVKSLPWLILTDRIHVVRAEGFGLSELDAKYEDLNTNNPKASAEKTRPGVSQIQNDKAVPVDLSDIALLYHREPDVRIKALKTLTASNNPEIIDDLIRAHSVEIYTPVHNEYDRLLQSLTGNRNVRGKGVWKAWLASEVEAGRLKIEYLPVEPDANVRSEILSIALMGPGDFDEMATALTAATYDGRKCQDAIRYMVFNDNLVQVQEFLAGDWLARLFAHQKITINDVGYFLNGLANPGPLRKQIDTHVRNCLDSENPTVVTNALNLIAGVEGYATRFVVPGVDDKVIELTSSSVPEVAFQAKRALERIRPIEKLPANAKIVSGQPMSVELRRLVEDLPGALIFHGRYKHISGGRDYGAPGELWLKQYQDAFTTAIAHLPFMETTNMAFSDGQNRLIHYREQKQASSTARPGYVIDLELLDSKVLLTRRGVRQDCDGKELKVPKGALFSPNSRPDSYCASNILIRGFDLAEGQSKEFRVYDWDNSGEAMADYTIRVSNAGTESVDVPAGTFKANHIVLTQLTSADTWFKKRTGHVTDFWVLDNGVIVRVLRHREPYEIQLLDYTTPAELPGKTTVSKQTKAASVAKSGLQRMIDSAGAEATVIIPKGVYAEPVTITKSLTLKGESLNECVIEVTANEPAIFVDTKGKGKVLIEAMTIKWQLATSDRCEYPFAVAVKDSKVEVKNCYLQPLGNFKRSPVAIYSRGFSELNVNTCRFEGFEYTACFGEGTKGSIRNSLIMDSGHQGIMLYAGATAEITGNVVTGSRFHAVRSTGGTLNMTDNLIINNANRGVYLGNKSASGTISNNVIIGNGTGISGFARSNVKVENNVIADSSYAGIGMRDSCSLTIRDNIFQGNERGWILFKEGDRNSNTIDKNTFWRNKVETENLDKAAGSINADPGFVDAGNGDFSLKPGPALQQSVRTPQEKQGLTNPDVFKMLWKRWQNRADKNQPFAEISTNTRPEKTDM
jgi:beta-lactamase regulating signal transducer with metallopeptidase domain/protocatechuate 3,4-dioxygenase beta subunit